MKNKNPLIITGYSLLGLVVIAAIVVYTRHQTRPKVNGYEPKIIHEGKDSVVTIHGTNFPDPSELEITFNGVPALIQSASRNTLVVVAEVQKIKQVRLEDPLSINFYVKTGNKYILNERLTCELDKEPAVISFSPGNFINKPAIVFVGKNLNNPGIAVFINGQACSKENVSNNQLIVRAPDLPAGLASIPVIVMFEERKIHNGTGSTFKRWHPRFEARDRTPIRRVQ